MAEVAQTSKKVTKPRTLTGVVKSNKMQGSVVVAVERLEKHPLYRKYIKRTTKVHADDPKNECQQGDIVVVQECKPISKTKSWRLVEIKEKSQEAAS